MHFARRAVSIVGDEARCFGGVLLIFGENQASGAEFVRDLRTAAEAAHVDLSRLTILRHLAVWAGAVTI